MKYDNNATLLLPEQVFTPNISVNLFKNNVLRSLIFLLSLCWSAPSFAQVSGKIVLNKDFYDALQAQHGSNLLGTALQLEVWEVRYVNVLSQENGTKVPVTRIYLNEKWNSTPVKLTPTISGNTVNLSFTIQNLSANARNLSKYALVYYLEGYPATYQTVRFDQKANDGSGRTGVRYQANFSTAIGQKQALGLMSLTGTNAQSVTINLFSSTQVVAFGILDAIGDFFSDAAELVWEGGKTLGGILIDGAGTIIAQAFGIGQSLFLDDGVIIPRYREMSAAEYSFVNAKIFANTLPPREKIIITNLKGLGGRAFVWPTGVDGKILMNMGKNGYNNPMGVLGFYASGERAGQIFIHETTHVWQIHHSPDIQFTLQSLKNQAEFIIENLSGGNPQAIYEYECGGTWDSYNLEQQAGMVEACYINRELLAPHCEETYVEENIRGGRAFRSAACQQLLEDVKAKRKAVQDRINVLKVQWLTEQGETVVFNADGTIKVGADKGIDSVSIPTAILNNDSVLRQLKSELTVLEQRQRTTNCF